MLKKIFYPLFVLLFFVSSIHAAIVEFEFPDSVTSGGMSIFAEGGEALDSLDDL